MMMVGSNHAAAQTVCCLGVLDSSMHWRVEGLHQYDLFIRNQQQTLPVLLATGSVN